MTDKPKYVRIVPAMTSRLTAGRVYEVRLWGAAGPILTSDNGRDFWVEVSPWQPATLREWHLQEIAAGRMSVNTAKQERQDADAAATGTAPVTTQFQVDPANMVPVSDDPAPHRITATPVEPSGSVAHSILTEAAGIVQGARNATHGDKERSFQVIADLWNAYLDGRKTPGPVTPRDVSACMVLLKLARSVQGEAARDHFVDAAGYAAIAGELA